MRFIPKQCAQCPFRATSAPGWLGDYNAGAVFSSIWKGFPFFCHTRTNYKSPGWKERAMRLGKLCTGSLAFANQIHAPASPHPQVNEARKLVRLVVVEVMSAQQFGDHHQDWR